MPYDESQCNLVLKYPPTFYSSLGFFGKSLVVGGAGTVAALAAHLILR